MNTFYIVQNPSLGNGATYQWAHRTLTNLIKIIPHGLTQKPFSGVVLHPTKLTIEINHYIYRERSE